MPHFQSITTPRARLLTTALIAALIWLDYLPAAHSQRTPAPVGPPPVEAANHGVIARLVEQRDRPCDLIFIGASNVEYWSTNGRAVWDRFYAPRHAFNFGEGGDTTDATLWRLEHMDLRGLRPKVAVIFVGLNNLTDTPRQVAEGIGEVAAKTEEVFPGVNVIVVSLTPNGRNDAHVVETNRFLRGMADAQDFAYLDLYSHLPRSGDNWIGLRADHLHLNAHGYQIWAEQMEPLMQRLLPLEPPLRVADATAKP